MTFKFHTVTRLVSITLAGFALLAAGEAPQLTPTVLTLTVDSPTDQIAAAPVIKGDIDIADSDELSLGDSDITRPANLRTLVAQVDALPASPLNSEAKCLATAVFFEARGEPLEGQLAVAQVILNRVSSGRYPGSVCGVVYQPGQFTFARRAVNTRSSDWQTAEAIAIIAQAQSWAEVAPRAVSFHAARLNPGWGMQRISRIGNHVFYR